MNEHCKMNSSRTTIWTVLIIALLLPSLVTVIYFQILHGKGTGLQQFAFILGKSIQFGLPIAWVFKTTPRDIRFTTLKKAGLLSGVVFAVLVVSLMLVPYQMWIKPSAAHGPLISQVQEKLSGLGIDSAWKYGLVGVFYAVAHAFLEEYYWRWFVFGQLRKIIPLTNAIVISSLGFMAHHVIVLAFYFGWTSPLTYLFSLAVAIGGAFWAWLYQRSESIHSPWLSHSLVDAGIFLVGYDIAKPLF